MSGWALRAADSTVTVSPAPVIETPRVRLVPLGLADATAIVHGHRPPGARWAEGYPTDATLVVAGLLVTAEEQGGPLGPFRGYQIIRRDDGVAIGDCGFVGPPDEHGDVQIVFGVAEAMAAHRLAGEALRALIAWARDLPEVRRIIAETTPTNIAALRVLEQAGMRRTGEDGGLVLFEA